MFGTTKVELCVRGCEFEYWKEIYTKEMFTVLVYVFVVGD
jgi:hypothetical protein